MACGVALSTQLDYGVTFPRLVCSVSQTILLSPDYSCSEEILSIVSLLSVDTVLYNPPARREEVLAARKKFSSSEGDHMTLLSIYRAFKKVSGNKVSRAERGDVCGDIMLLGSLSNLVYVCRYRSGVGRTSSTAGT